MATPNRLSKGEVAVGAIDATDFIQISTSANTVTEQKPGRMYWNDLYGTVTLGMKNNLQQSIGQDIYVLVRNKTGSTLTKGTVVYATGSSGTNVNVTKAQANGEAASSKTLGVLAEDITNGNTGYCVILGLITGLNTSGLTEGANLWLSPTVPGGLTTTKPSAPNHAVSMGVCIRSQQNNGVILVRVINGFELEELHNVKITDPQDGQVLKYQASTGLWINSNP